MVRAHDPEATLALLWDGPTRPRRGPRHNLTVEEIVDAATRVAEEEGVGALSMRGVASLLGVGAATLYTYVPGKAALLASEHQRKAAEGRLVDRHDYAA